MANSLYPTLDDIVASVMTVTQYTIVTYRTQRDFDEEKYGHTIDYAKKDVAEADYTAMVRNGYGVKMYNNVGEFIKESAPK